MKGLRANSLSLFDDEKTYEVIYAWINDKLHRSSPLTHAQQKHINIQCKMHDHTNHNNHIDIHCQLYVPNVYKGYIFMANSRYQMNMQYNLQMPNDKEYIFNVIGSQMPNKKFINNNRQLDTNISKQKHDIKNQISKQK